MYKLTNVKSVVPVNWIRKLDVELEPVEGSRGGRKLPTAYFLTTEQEEELAGWCHYSDSDIDALPQGSQMVIKRIHATLSQAEPPHL